jgi:hypothetical protein
VSAASRAALPLKPLWSCPACRRAFAHRNQSHACAPLELGHHFRARAPQVRALYLAFVAALRRLGPVRVLPEKTRIAFQTRMSFAQLTPRRHYLTGHLVLAERRVSPKFLRIDTISPRNHVHHFRLESASFLDAQFRALLRAAYAVGNQQHIRGSANTRSPR